MPYGQKMGSLKALKDSLKKGSGGFIKYVPKNGSLTVRFLEEPEHWVNYTEHYDSTLRKSYPCNGESTCPGCVSEERKSSRYLANAVDTSTDRVIPLQMPKELANRLVVRYEKNGTITDRDYELSRSGEGLDTVYDLDAEPPTNRKLSKYATRDLLKDLDDAFNAVFGADDEDDEDAKPVKKAGGVKPRQKSAAASKAQADEAADDDDDDDDVPDALKTKAERAKAAKKAAAAPAFQADDDEDADDDDDTDDDDADDDAEDADDSDSDDADDDDAGDEDADDDDASGEDADGGDDDEDDYFTEEELSGMALGALRALSKEYDPPIPTQGLTKPQIIQAILNYGSEDDDDE